MKDPRAIARGKKGGAAGRGDSKRRPIEHYRKAGRRSGEKRRNPDIVVPDHLLDMAKQAWPTKHIVAKSED